MVFFPRNGNVLRGMMRRCSRTVILLAMAALMVVSTCVGSRAEYLGPVDAGGVRDMVAQARGSVVVVNFWASWCAPCRAEIPHLVSLREAFDEADMLLLGISVDFEPDAAKAYAEEAGMTYPVYIGNEDILDAFEVGAIPKTMIWDREGNLAVDHLGLLPPAVLHDAVKELVGE